mgnify:CR=1 FL=1
MTDVPSRQPELYPLLPSNPTKRFGASASAGLAVMFYTASKLISVAILSSAFAPGIWFLVEVVLFLAVLVNLGQWRWYQRALDSILFATFENCGMYLAMLVAPVTILRQPFFFSPAVWSSFILYSLFLANPLMCLVGFAFSAPNFSSTKVVLSLGATTSACMLFSLAH